MFYRRLLRFLALFCWRSGNRRIVPLDYWQDDDSEHDRVRWTNFTSTVSRPLAAGAEWSLRFAVRRRELTATVPASALYQSLLEISDSGGAAHFILPVTSEGIQNTSAGALRAKNAAGPKTVVHPYAGLWVGSASIGRVSQPASGVASNLLTASEFQFRLLVHVDASGQARFLQKVVQMWKDGTYKPDPTDPTVQIVDQPGRFVLVADDRLISGFSGATLRDGQPVARHFSTAAFSFSSPLLMSAARGFGAGGSVFSCPISLPYTNALYPFVHRFHPDHDNLDESFAQQL